MQRTVVSTKYGREGVEFKLVADGAKEPIMATPVAAGFDIFALEDRAVTGGDGTVLVPTGVAVKIPPGYYARIAPRSGLAFNNHIAVDAGVIDEDYFPRPIGVLLHCSKVFNADGSRYVYQVKAGDKVAQLIIEKIAPVIATRTYSDGSVEISNDNFGSLVTDHAGFGSTGK
jgi:dUTP pyrophosphatase